MCGDAATFGALLTACRAGTGSRATFSWVSEQFLLAEGVEPFEEVPLWIADADEKALYGISNARGLAAGLELRTFAETARDTWEWLQAVEAGELPATPSAYAVRGLSAAARDRSAHGVCRFAVTSISIFMRGSSSGQTCIVAAGSARPKVAPEHRPARLEVLGARQQVAHAHDVVEAGTGLLERRGDRAQRLVGLLGDVVGDRHRRVVEAGGARDEDPIAVGHGARVADLALERGARGDALPGHAAPG